MKHHIDVKDVFFTYTDEEMNAVNGVSFTVEEGEFVAILGHNGSGKSTLCKLLNALHLPTEGMVWVLGMDTQEEELIFTIRKNAGMVFQNPDNQLVATMVEEDVAFGPENLGVPQAEIRKRVDETLLAVRMQEFAHHAPDKLSGGQKQRVAIAGVLAMHPKIILLDEPTAMLDPRGRKEVIHTVRKLNRQGMTVVWVTHFMEEAVQAHRVMVMENGKIACSGSPREVFSDAARLKALGLDVPPATDLADQLAQAGIPISRACITMEEVADFLCPLS